MGADARPGGNGNQGYVWGPDGINIEYYGDPAIPVPVKMDHTHSFVPDIAASKELVHESAWRRTRSASARVESGMERSRPLSGMTVTFAGSQGGATLAPTQGRSLDHMGFEVKDLAAYVRRLEALGIKVDTESRQIPGTRIASAYITDPWGTRIELTQNLAPASRK